MATLREITKKMKTTIINHIKPERPELMNVIFREVSKNEKARLTLAGHINDVRKAKEVIEQGFEIEGLNWRECDPEYACLYFCER